MHDDYSPKMLQIRARIGRIRFTVYSLGIWLTLFSTLFLCFDFLPQLNQKDSFEENLSLVAVLSTFLLAGIKIFFDTRRLHDVNITGWAAVLTFVPLINIVFDLFLMLAPGTRGDNKYGRPPLPNGRKVYIALTLLIFLPLLIFVLYGIYGHDA
ncbi:DUF805 domain-containing protein [Salinisphaera sp. Q1T1-3]|uniref:DUF805 domain-containing protein n=1 Tax=Salinisphaera sp. Q1T1-3 TaxID=2321229 RepID=UPI001313E6A5|nr:DUF805 domain-containing protein [Salinisphaera sp. Q1T1-3]